MTLQDFVRVQSRDVEQAIALLNEKIPAVMTERAGAELRARRAREEANKLRPIADERDVSRRTIEVKIGELERQIDEFTLRLEERKQELARARRDVSEVQDKSAEFRRREDAEVERYNSLTATIDQLTGERERWQKRLMASRRAALTAYGDDVWQRMQQMAASYESRKGAIEASRALSAVRQTDVKVMELCEAREEWLKILRSSAPPLVRTTATAEVQRIEAALEERFPGALQAGVESTESEIVELYYWTPNEDAGTLRLHVPIPISTWGRFASDSAVVDDALAVRLVWALSKALPLAKSGGELKHIAETQILDASIAESALADAEVKVEIPPIGVVSIIFSALPAELREAFREVEN